MMNRIVRVMRSVDRGDEQGFVLANVIIFGMIVTMIVAAMVALSTAGSLKSGNDRNYQNAAAAAYAGLADYQAKISNDNGYATYGNKDAQFSKDSGSVFQGDNGNVAFTSSGSTWAPVVGTTDEFFRYEVDNSKYASQGFLRVRVTGKSGTKTRSLVADLRGDGFINYLYFTQYESADNDITGDNCTNDYQWQATSRTCDPVQFASGDVLNGAIRSDDDFTACGSTFNSSVEDHSGKVLAPSGCTTTPKYNGGQPSAAAYLGLPSLNTNMAQEARTDLPTTVPRPGCLYTGPTKVQFNSGGTMTIWSPWTRFTQVTATSHSSDTAAADALCGSSAALQSASGATIPTLPTNLMYVQGVPTTKSDPNYWGSSYPQRYTNTYCTTKVTVSGNSVSYSDNQTFSNGVGYPTSNEWIGTDSTPGTASSVYSCTAGDVFVSGTFSGHMTIASAGTVWVTGDITYTDPNDDILGLVGQNAVEVYNPMTCWNYQSVYYQGYGNYVTCRNVQLVRSAGTNLTIDAAIASNNGTFYVQNYDQGSALGTLTVKGSIAQKYRGTVATSNSGNGKVSTGFTKNYIYDNRLLTTAPPKFLQPVSTSYGVTTQVEVQPAYNPDGSCATTGGKCR
ncbi:hypothetical protein [Curtobacterium sp. MCBD17_003]|uniref:hypothetical protein n=1 Tax=Curtobacterium sp. MCBD17_003 TaxID=2175667 RepID=UPI000DA99D5E|nr:hypothetical protein [Curtobacterium sp. MCBD17_003]WIE54898.1 hypothetical protein DEI88_001455 [Curtobacterium sp. MCBD17_003]